MCGVGGIFFRNPDGNVPSGEIAYRILEGIYRRGPDSTGVAVLQPPEKDLLYIGVSCQGKGSGAHVLEKLDELGRVREATDGEGYIRAAITYTGDNTALIEAIDALGPDVRVSSVGRTVEVLKHMGGVENLEKNFHLKNYRGQLVMGLTRFATESRIDFINAQPLSARLTSDLVIMHNGHITNFHYLRYSYEQLGYTFGTANDSEVIAIMLVDEMSKGLSFEEALKKSTTLLDGCFTYIAVTDKCVAVVKDPYAAKPLVVGETDEFVAMSSDCQSLREGVQTDIDVWEPGAGEVALWQL